MRSNPDPSWNWQQGAPPPPPATKRRHKPKRRKATGGSLPEGFEPKQPFGAMAFPPEPNLGRKAGRLKLLKWTAPIAALIALLGLWLTSLFLWTMVTRTQAEGGNLASAERQYVRQEQVTAWFPEPWLAQYNLGTTRLMGGDLSEGVEALTLALEGVPKAVRGESGVIQPFSYECMVRMNLAAGIEMQGDQATAQSLEEKGTELYREALDLVLPCEVPSSQDPSDDAGESGFDDSSEEQNEGAAEQFKQDGNEAGDRLREKLGEGQPDPADSEQEQQSEPAEGEQGSQHGSGPFDGETQEERERREELESHNREQAERQRENEESGRRNPGIGGW